MGDAAVKPADAVAPAIIGLLVLGGWEWLVRHNAVPSYVLPGPVADRLELMRATIEALGGEIRFETRVTDFDIDNGQMRALHL